MNIYFFWILFLALWTFVLFMIIKVRVNALAKIKNFQEVKLKKKVGFKENLFQYNLN